MDYVDRPVTEPSAARVDYPWFTGSRTAMPGPDDPSFAFFRLFQREKGSGQ